MNDTPEQPTTPLPDSTPQPTPADAQPTTPLQPAPQTPQPQAPQAQAPQQPGQPLGQQPGQPAPGYAAAPPGAVPPQQPAGYPAPAPQAPTNTLAIIAFVGSFFVSLVGIICGHIALGQIKKTGERGRGFALAGTIIGYVALAGTVLAIVFTFVILGATAATVKGLSDSAADQLEQIEQEAQGESTDQFDDSTTDPGTEATGGDRSAEFCAAFMELSEFGEDLGSDEVNQQALDAFRKLSEIDSPNQEVYQRFYEYVKDPVNADSNDLEPLMSDYFDAAMSDGMACA